MEAGNSRHIRELLCWRRSRRIGLAELDAGCLVLDLETERGYYRTVSWSRHPLRLSILRKESFRCSTPSVSGE